MLGKLANRRCLARAVDPDHQDHRRRVRNIDAGLCARQKIGNLLGQRGRKILAGSHPTSGSTPLETPNDLDRCGHAAVGQQQRLLESLPRLGVIRIEGNGLNLTGQRLAGLGETIDESAEEAATLLWRLSHWLGELDVAKAREHQMRIGHRATNRSATARR